MVKRKHIVKKKVGKKLKKNTQLNTKNIKNAGKKDSVKKNSFPYLRLMILLMLVAIIGISLSVLWYTSLMVRDTILIEYEFTLEHGVIGLNADSNRLAFGKISPGGTSMRDFTIAPAYAARVIVVAEGTGVEMISVSENIFDLEADEERRVIFTIIAPKNALEGDYTGNIRVMLLRPGISLLGPENENLLPVNTPLDSDSGSLMIT